MTEAQSAMHPWSMSGGDKGLQGRRGGDRRQLHQGPWPVLLAMAVGLVGPVLFVLFPSRLMFWVMWLFMVPLVVLMVYVSRKAEMEDKRAPEELSSPHAQHVWWTPSDL
jgi:hypothetical protein